MVTREIKELYNTYLAVTRSCRNQPFRLRNNFEGFEQSKEFILLNKISLFLANFKQIKPRLYFEAPYRIYNSNEYFDLKFYTSQKAIVAYTTYMKQLQEESPDSEHHIQFIKDSLRFIAMFCIKNKIHLFEYISHSGGVTKSFMKHIKEHNVSIYSLFGFPELFRIVQETPKDEIDLLLGNISNSLSLYKNKFMTSRTARRIVGEGMKRINRVIEETIDQSNNVK